MKIQLIATVANSYDKTIPRSDLQMPAPIALQCMDMILEHLRKMNNGLEVITEELSISEQLHRLYQVLPETHTLAEYKAMYSQVIRDYYSGTLQFSRLCRTEKKNILKSV